MDVCKWTLSRWIMDRKMVEAPGMVPVRGGDAMKKNHLKLVGRPRHFVILIQLIIIWLLFLATPVPVWGQGGIQDITGAWTVTVTVTEKTKKTVYEFGWVIRRIGDGWWVERMLLKTGNPNQQWMVGKTWNEYSLAFKDGVWEYKGMFGAKAQWAACTFRKDSFSCTGSQREFTITEEITIEGVRQFRIVDDPGPPKLSNRPSSNAPGAFKVAVVGDAEIIRDGQNYKLTSDMVVSSGDTIVTGMDSSVRVYLEDNLVVVSELTSTTVEKLYSKDKDGGRTLLWLKAGEVSAEINRSSHTSSDFSVKAAIASGPRGHHASNMVKTLVVTANQSETRFSVRNNQQTGIATVSVTAGAVAVATENGSLQSLTLGANQRVEVTRNSVSPITSITAAEKRAPTRGEGTDPEGSSPGVNIGGPWVTPTGDVITLTQNGNRVTGTYRGALGTGAISGTFDGRMLTGTLEIEQLGIRVSQRLTLRLTDGRLEGTLATPLSTINLILSRPTN